MQEPAKAQLLAATIAALAGVTGAFGGAWLANRNAIAITNKQVESAERTTLRGNRQAAYSDFIEALQEEDRDLTRMASALDQMIVRRLSRFASDGSLAPD